MPTATLASSLADVRRAVITRLRVADVDSAVLDANVLIGHALGVAPERVPLQLDDDLDPEALRAIEAVTLRRERREPVAYITGRKAFRRLSIAVNRNVLIPRPETELLVEVGLGLWDASGGASAVDIGAGSGAIALALADERPGRRVLATDRSRAALRVATGNAHRMKLADQVRFCLADGAAGVDLSGAVVVANLPYIPSAVLGTLQPEISRWEPAVALDGGADGLAVIRKLAAQLGRTQARAAAFEIGSDQAGVVTELVQRAGFVRTTVYRDLAGEPRVVAGTRVS